MHCFNDNYNVGSQWMTDWLHPDYYSREVVLNISLDRLLCETDSPHFVPLVEVRHTAECVCVLIHADFSIQYACGCVESIAAHKLYGSTY
jgi:Tat protein secretion system quality control protein TatD with DNase activity